MRAHQIHPTDTLDNRVVLASRSTAGVTVSLLWERETNISAVSVNARAGGSFELVVEENTDALHVFHHPYSHAAWRGVVTDEAAERAAA